jgi:hypothetical protein
MNKHTPGPWNARKVGGPAFKNQVLWAIDYNKDQEQVVDFVYEEADATLIAAAPDLLAALEACESAMASCMADFNQYDQAAYDAARAAIARARGES